MRKREGQREREEEKTVFWGLVRGREIQTGLTENRDFKPEDLEFQLILR